MDKEYWIILITTVLAISGYFIKKYIDNRSEKKESILAFNLIKNQIEDCNKRFIDQELYKLRKFLLNNPKYLKGNIKEFFDRQLTTNQLSIINEGESSYINFNWNWDGRELEKMLQELKKLTI